MLRDKITHAKKYKAPTIKAVPAMSLSPAWGAVEESVVAKQSKVYPPYVGSPFGTILVVLGPHIFTVGFPVLEALQHLLPAVLQSEPL